MLHLAFVQLCGGDTLAVLRRDRVKSRTEQGKGYALNVALFPFTDSCLHSARLLYIIYLPL